MQEYGCFLQNFFSSLELLHIPAKSSHHLGIHASENRTIIERKTRYFIQSSQSNEKKVVDVTAKKTLKIITLQNEILQSRNKISLWFHIRSIV